MGWFEDTDDHASRQLLSPSSTSGGGGGGGGDTTMPSDGNYMKLNRRKSNTRAKPPGGEDSARPPYRPDKDGLVFYKGVYHVFFAERDDGGAASGTWQVRTAAAGPCA
jgi:hypothetical protein